MEKLNLILDMDSTLISNFGPTIRSRPHLQTFFTFCFSNFNTVSVWTAADRVWFDAVNNSLFQPLMKKIALQLKKPCQFRFVYVRPSGDLMFSVRPENNFRPQPMFVKDLHKIWRRKRMFPEFTKDNTLIVDDTPSTFCMNYHNALHIPAYAFNNGGDRELLKLMFFLRDIGEHYTQYKTVINMDKRKWYMKDTIVQQMLQLVYNSTMKVKTI
jgi:hypothetical protein